MANNKTTSAAPSDAELAAFTDAFDWDRWICPTLAKRAFARAVVAHWTRPTPPAVVEPPELSPDFTDTARAALLWVLWHHQGGSSPVGQPIRFALGMGQHDSLNEHQLSEAKRWERLHPANPAVFPRGPDPLSDDTIMNAFCNTPGLSPRQMVSCFIAGARFAEQSHGIGIKKENGHA